MRHDVIVSQYLAALKMLRAAVEACPETLWDRSSDRNRFWVIAYHTVYHAHLYLSPSQETFEPWEVEVKGHPAFGRDHLGDWRKLSAEDVYSKADILAYCDHVTELVAPLVQAVDFDASSGFDWLRFSRGEAHFDNIRHIQHHAGQLIERLRQEVDQAVDWIASGR